MTTYDYKIKKYIAEEIKDIINPTIIEFGVKEGRSTKLFLDLCENKCSDHACQITIHSDKHLVSISDGPTSY